MLECRKVSIRELYQVCEVETGVVVAQSYSAESAWEMAANNLLRVIQRVGETCDIGGMRYEEATGELVR